MNTRFEYLYRDGHNYKQYNEVVLEGEFTLDQLRPYLYEGQYFMPSEVGLEDLQEYPYKSCDHVWHELVSAALTEEPPTADMAAENLVVRFRKAGEVKWETSLVNERMMEMA